MPQVVVTPLHSSAEMHVRAS